MGKAWLITSIASAIVLIVGANVKSTQSPPVSSGFTILSFFVFLWFVIFVLPRFKE
jgi:hypothetical protein